MDKNSDADVLTVEETAQLLRLSAYTIRQLAREGEIPARKVGRVWRFSRRALIDYVEKGERKG